MSYCTRSAFFHRLRYTVNNYGCGFNRPKRTRTYKSKKETKTKLHETADEFARILKVDPTVPTQKILSSSLIAKAISIDSIPESEHMSPKQRNSLANRMGKALKIAFPDSPEVWGTKPLGPRPQTRYNVGLAFW